MTHASIPPLDMNLLVALDALLSEGSVAGAAQRMNLSAPAMSRQLTRIRHRLGDPILVRAGRRLVPTPRALELQSRVHELVESAQSLLRPEGNVDPSSLQRGFIVRASDYVAGVFGIRLFRAMENGAPLTTLRFMNQGERFANQVEESTGSLRDGSIDLDIGVMSSTGPEIRVQTLMQERFVAVVRKRHPALKGKMDVQRFAALSHISVSRRGRTQGPIDQALAELGSSRTVKFVVPTFYAALFAAASSDIVAALPLGLVRRARELGLAVDYFDLPVTVPVISIGQSWHPRFDNDGGHRWLRQMVRETFSDLHEKPRRRSSD